ncbi:MAG: AAA family ATPase [Isosphaeraceae bacterium]
MYIESLELDRIKTFVGQKLDFVHPDRDFWPRGKKGKRENGMLPQPLLPNVNLILGDNGAGKSTVLRAIAMSVLGALVHGREAPGSGASTAGVCRHRGGRVSHQFHTPTSRPRRPGRAATERRVWHSAHGRARTDHILRFGWGKLESRL